MSVNPCKDKYTNGYLISEDGNIVIRMNSIDSISFSESENSEYYIDLYINEFKIGSILNNDNIKKSFIDKLLEFIDKNESVSFNYIKENLN